MTEPPPRVIHLTQEELRAFLEEFRSLEFETVQWFEVGIKQGWIEVSITDDGRRAVRLTDNERGLAVMDEIVRHSSRSPIWRRPTS